VALFTAAELFFINVGVWFTGCHRYPWYCFPAAVHYWVQRYAQ